MLASTHYIEPNENQSECLIRSEGYAQAVSVLCSEDQSGLSDNYVKYLDSSEKVVKAMEDYNSATDKAGRDLAVQNFRHAQKEESIYENTVRTALSNYSDAIEACLSKK